VKHHGIRHASAFIAVSRNTALDLIRFHPPAANSMTIAHNGIDTSQFYPSSATDIDQFRKQHSIDKPYFLYIGDRTAYKNGWLFFAGLAALPNRSDFEVVCVGGHPTLEPDFAVLVPDVHVHVLALSDEALRSAYSGAIAFVYPSLYEGFGLPILEAMACNCPVITCHNSSIPEVAGAAALYVEFNKPDEMTVALQHIQRDEVRQHLIHMGQRQIKKFSWGKWLTG